MAIKSRCRQTDNLIQNPATPMALGYPISHACSVPAIDPTRLELSNVLHAWGQYVGAEQRLKSIKDDKVAENKKAQQTEKKGMI